MSQIFSLYQRPSGIYFLDDDYTYLEMLSIALPKRLTTHFFIRPQAFIDGLRVQAAAWEEDLWQHQQMVIKWYGDEPLIPQVLSYWRQSMKRFYLVDVCVVDYYMPAMNGVEAIESLEHWHGSSILLTGRAEEKTAINAFNRGLINKFIEKQAPRVNQTIVDAAAELSVHTQQRLADVWLATLSPKQQKMLQDKEVAQNLKRISLEREWVEYVTLGSPFSILGLKSSGAVEWLKLEHRHNLDDLSEIAYDSGLSSSIARKISDGEVLIDLELRLDLKSNSEPRILNAFPLNSDGSLLGCIFPVPEKDSAIKKTSYDDYLLKRAPRIIVQ